MTKKDISKRLAKRLHVSQKDAVVMCNEFTEIIKETIKTGESIYVRGFGTFSVKRRKARKARDINKETFIVIPERNEPSFKPCKIFREEVNNGVEY